MADVSPRLVTALRRVTDLPVRDCQSLLRECGGDVGRVFDVMAIRLYFGRVSAADRDRRRDGFVTAVTAELERVPDPPARG